MSILDGGPRDHVTQIGTTWTTSNITRVCCPSLEVGKLYTSLQTHVGSSKSSRTVYRNRVDCAFACGLGTRHSCDVDFPLHSCQVANCLAEDSFIVSRAALPRLRQLSTPITLVSVPPTLNGYCSLVASIVSMSSGEINEHCAVIHRHFACSANHHEVTRPKPTSKRSPGSSPQSPDCALLDTGVDSRLDTLDLLGLTSSSLQPSHFGGGSDRSPSFHAPHFLGSCARYSCKPESSAEALSYTLWSRARSHVPERKCLGPPSSYLTLGPNFTSSYSRHGEPWMTALVTPQKGCTPVALINV